MCEQPTIMRTLTGERDLWICDWLANHFAVENSKTKNQQGSHRPQTLPPCCHLESYFKRPKSSPVRPFVYNRYYCAQFIAKPKAACALRFSWAATFEQPWLMSKYDVIHKTGSTWRITTLPEEVISNMHGTFGEDRTCSSEDMIADRQTNKHTDRQTDRQTDTLITILRSPTAGAVTTRSSVDGRNLPIPGKRLCLYRQMAASWPGTCCVRQTYAVYTTASASSSSQ